jgi:hypothetical protein
VNPAGAPVTVSTISPLAFVDTTLLELAGANAMLSTLVNAILEISAEEFGVDP